MNNKNFIAPVILLLACQVITVEESNAQTKAQKKTPPKNSVQRPAKPKPTADAFLKEIQNKIYSVPNTKEVKEDTKVVVLIKIDGTGKLLSTNVTKSSGFPELDEMSLERVKKAAPFGVMPDSFKNGLNLTYTFEYRAPVQAGSGESPDTSPYMDKLASKVGEIWEAPEVARDCTVAVNFILNKDGTIKSITITRPSGFSVVDNAAVEAIKRSQPFGALPEPLETMPVNYTFSAGPKNQTANQYRFNDVPIKQKEWQITRGGATLKPLDATSKIENKVRDRNWKIQDEIAALKVRLAKASANGEKAKILVEIGRNYKKINDFENATKSYEKAAEIFESENKADEAVLKAELAEAYASKGDTTNAIKLYDESTSKLRENKEENKEELKNVLVQYAKTLYKMNKVAEANKLYAEVKTLK